MVELTYFQQNKENKNVVGKTCMLVEYIIMKYSTHILPSYPLSIVLSLHFYVCHSLHNGNSISHKP